MRTKLNFLLGILLLLVLAVTPALAGSSAVNLDLIGDHQLVGEFSLGLGCLLPVEERRQMEGLKGGLGSCYEGKIFLSFDDPDSLLTSSLQVTVEEVDPEDQDLLSRFPSSGIVVPSEFPVLISITDNVADGFSFDRQWEMEIETRNLAFDAHSPLRLFRASEGCPAPGCSFEDFTFSSGFGSYRVRGSFGTFSDFIIAADLRPRRAVVTKKLEDLDQSVDDLESDGLVSVLAAIQLRAKLLIASLAHQTGDLLGAFSGLLDLIDTIEANVGGGIEDTWDPDLSKESAVGILLGGARSAAYSVEIEARPRAASTAGFSQQLSTTPNGFGVEVSVLFDEVTDLQPGSLGVLAVEVDPFDAGLLSRLPAGVALDADFPVMVKIGADSSRRPSARGDWEIGLRTRDLAFQQGSTFRLFGADSGGDFEDITRSMGVGSLVARGTVAKLDHSSFTEFLLVRDSRQTATVATDKFLALEQLLAGFSLDQGLADELDLELSIAKSEFLGGDPGTAISELDELLETIEENAGDGLLDIWLAGDPRVNEAGLLAAGTKTLQFSLALAEAPLEADPADVNRDGKVDAADVFTVIERVYCPSGCAEEQAPLQSPAGR